VQVVAVVVENTAKEVQVQAEVAVLEAQQQQTLVAVVVEVQHSLLATMLLDQVVQVL
jgi:hypothetical protein